jgi:hypothetical protein
MKRLQGVWNAFYDLYTCVNLDFGANSKLKTKLDILENEINSLEAEADDWEAIKQ